MTPLKGRTRSRLAAALLAAGLAAGLAPQAGAQTKVTVSALTFPSSTNIVDDVIQGKAFDKENGIELVPSFAGTAGASYASIAKGELLMGVLSPFVVAKMRGEGVPLTILATLTGMATIQVVTTNPAVKQFSDLKGRSLAATVGFSEFQYIEMYAKSIGIDIRKDISLVDASTSLAQAQLQAGRVDAVILWEPSATQAMATIPDTRVILTGDEAWRHVAGTDGWDVFLWVNSEWAKAHGGILPRIVKMYKDAGDFMRTNPEDADAIVTSNRYTSKNLPPGSIAAAIKGHRLIMDVKSSWDPETNKQIWQMLKLGVDDGEIAALPAEDAVLDADPAK